MIIPLIQTELLNTITTIIKSIKIGAIISTILLFFLPAMLIGMLSPIIIKIKIEDIEKAGKTSGKIYAIATVGSIIGTFLGGFYLVPSFGCNEILFFLAIIMFLVLLYANYEKTIKSGKKIIGITLIGILASCICFRSYTYSNNQNGIKVMNGDLNIKASYDTQYGRVLIYNTEKNDEKYRQLNIDKGHESATYIDEYKCNELVYEYTKFYDMMFKSKKEIQNALMIGGAGYSYPKYYISHYLNKNMDVVEIDKKVTEIAKKYFYLDKLIQEYDLSNNKRLNLINEDGRVFLNNNTKKYDAILNDAFSGDSPAKTLTTVEAVQKIHESLNEKGVYLSNVISSIDGENSNFIKAEIKTLNQVFENVYVIPCLDKDDYEIVQNNMVIATDDELFLEDTAKVNTSDAIILTDNFCPVDSLIPQIK